MLFSDSPRFDKSVVGITSGELQAFATVNTEDHVGPGTYLHSGREDMRNGWIRKSFNTKRNVNMLPSNDSRTDSYVHGTMGANGLLSSPRAKLDRETPGPGHYEGTTSISASPRTQTPGRSPRKELSESVRGMQLSPRATFSSKGGALSHSPRFSFGNSTCMRDGVLFQSHENELNHVGPGYYDVHRNSFLKKSHNVRAQQASALAASRSDANFSASYYGSPRQQSSQTQPSPSSASQQPRQRPQSCGAAGQARSPAGSGGDSGDPRSNFNRHRQASMHTRTSYASTPDGMGLINSPLSGTIMEGNTPQRKPSQRRFFADSPTSTPEFYQQQEGSGKGKGKGGKARASSAPRMGNRKNPAMGNLQRKPSTRAAPAEAVAY